ncbi:MAG: phosphopantetheine-binding protein, partial [Henriciella sp.]
DYMEALRSAHAQYLQASAAILGAASSVADPAPATQRREFIAPPVEPQSISHTQMLPAGNGHAFPSPKASQPVHVAPMPPPAARPQPEAAPAQPSAAMASQSVAQASSPPVHDFSAIVTSLVSEKTGYPADMLEPDMDLEGELGVDSIKQVEILSALRDQMPDLPEIEPEQIAELRTIRKIADFLSPATSIAVAAPAPTAAPAHVNGNGNGYHASDPAQPAFAAPSADMTELVRSLIAEKTGYPADMLEDDMDLEGELGVDSIKQVEILSALRDAMPNLPEVEPEQIAELRSIRKIADFFR